MQRLCHSLYLAPPRSAAGTASSCGEDGGLAVELRRRDLMNTNLGTITMVLVLALGAWRWHGRRRGFAAAMFREVRGGCPWLAVEVAPRHSRGGHSSRGGRGPGVDSTRTRGANIGRTSGSLGMGDGGWGTDGLSARRSASDVGDSASSRNERELVRRRARKSPCRHLGAERAGEPVPAWLAGSGC